MTPKDREIELISLFPVTALSKIVSCVIFSKSCWLRIECTSTCTLCNVYIYLFTHKYQIVAINVNRRKCAQSMGVSRNFRMVSSMLWFYHTEFILFLLIQVMATRTIQRYLFAVDFFNSSILNYNTIGNTKMLSRVERFSHIFKFPGKKWQDRTVWRCFFPKIVRELKFSISSDFDEDTPIY